MKRRLMLGAAPAALVAANAAANVAANAGESIRALMQAQQEAWNRGDIAAFMQAYWKSPELAFIGESITRGWQATFERYQKRYPTRAAMGTLNFSELEVHEVGAEAAWVYGRFALRRSAEGGGDAKGKFTLVWKRVAGEWKMVMDHTSS
jgi:ketosteroid isomerase-like protein